MLYGFKGTNLLAREFEWPFSLQHKVDFSVYGGLTVAYGRNVPQK